MRRLATDEDPIGAAAPPGRTDRDRPRRVIKLVAGAGLVVTAVLFLVARRAETSRMQEDVARKVELTATMLQREVDEPLHLLRSVEGFFLSSRDVSRREFWGFTRDALAAAGGVQAVEWIPRVPDALRGAHEAAARAEGLPLYQISDADDRGHLAPAARRSFYLPIVYAEAVGAARARLEFGRDLAGSPTDLAAMNSAVQMARPAAGIPFPRLEGTSMVYRCRVFAGVFTNLVAHDTPEQRRRNFAGFATVVLDLQPLCDAALRRLPGLERDGFTWQLLDDSVRGAWPIRLYQSVRWIDQRAQAGPSGAVRFTMAGRSWVLQGRPTSGYLAAIHARQSGWVLAGGLVTTLLLLGYLSSVLGRAALVERWVEERTAALDRTNLELRGEIARRREMEAALEQERYLAGALLDSIPDHIYFKDRASRFIRINRAMAKRFGLASPEDAVGKTDFDFFTVEHAQSAFTDEQEILRSGAGMVDGEEAETWPDGSTTWVSTTKQCLRDKDGKVVGTFGLSRDITSRKRAERRLAVQYQVAQVLAEAETFETAAPRILEEVGRCLGWTFGAVWIVEPSGTSLRGVEIWRAPEAPAPEFESATRELSLDKGIGLPGRVLAGGEPIWIKDVVSDPNFPRAALALKAGLHGAFGFPIRTAHEVLGVIEFFSRRIEQPDEDLAQMFSAVGNQIGQFITRQRMKRALTEKARELERSNQDLEQFAYVASHDLQEPLRMISSYTQLLERRYAGQLDADAHEFIRFAVEGSARLQALINDLLAYSRVGNRTGTFTAVPSGEILKRALKNLEIAIEESHAQVSSDPLPVVCADAIQLTQLFQNLVGNALKFRGDKPAVVHISAQNEIGGQRRCWHFAVRDQGIGIASEYFERIFVLFQRLHSREDYPGTGIGLAVCKKIVERHGGRIWVESEPGQGTTFHFSLPAV